MAATNFNAYQAEDVGAEKKKVSADHSKLRRLPALQQGPPAIYGLHVEEGDAIAGAPVTDTGAAAGLKTSTVKVTFKTPFNKPPVVHASFRMLDFANSNNVRADVDVKNVTNTGFDCILVTWSDTKVHNLRARWLAIGSSNSTGQLITV